MPGILTLLALASVAAWAVLLWSRGGFWHADQRLDPAAPHRDALSGTAPSVVVVIPARDEAAHIGTTLISLLGQNYPQDFPILVIDDHSSDGTAEAAQAIDDRRITVIPAAPLPPGWTGKLWALQQGVDAALARWPAADYLLLTDADMDYAPGLLARLMAKAMAERLDMASLMAMLDRRGGWAHLLIPAFVFFFQKLYPFAWVNDTARRTAAAAGGCVLIRRRALERIGGFHYLRGRIIDDCALAGLVKPGGAIWLGLTGELHSQRRYARLSDIWSMVTRTAFEQLNYSGLLLGVTVLGMAVVYLAPPAAVLLGLLTADRAAMLLGALAWAMMATAYGPTLRFYGFPAWRALTLPAAAALFTLMTLDAARLHWRGTGGLWKGRIGGGAVTPAAGPLEDSTATEAAETAVARSSTSFYWAMRLLPARKRQAMYAIYAFCREVDDIADEPGEAKAERLEEWRAEIGRLYCGKPGHAVSRALMVPVARFNLPKAEFLAIIDGMAMDAAPSVRIRTEDELALYCDRVACAVGRLCNRVFGVEAELGQALAANLGEALQLTNILRDLREDAALDRLYLPADLLQTHGINAADPYEVLDHPALPAVCAVLADRAESRFRAAADLCRHDPRLRPARIMMAVYHCILNRLERRGWHRLDQPVPLSKAHKLWIALTHAIP